MGTDPPKRAKHVNVVRWPRIDRLRYTRFGLPVWMAAVALLLHDRYRPMTLAAFATTGMAVLVVWEVLRERMKSERVRRQLMAEIGGFVWTFSRFEGLRLALVAVTQNPGHTVMSVRELSAARRLARDPTFSTWAGRAIEADLDVHENVRMYLIHGQAALEDLYEWERAFSHGEMDFVAGKSLLTDYDNRKNYVITWYANWLKAEGMDWEKFAAEQEATLATPIPPAPPLRRAL